MAEKTLALALRVNRAPNQAFPSGHCRRSSRPEISPRPIGHADKLFDENGNRVNDGTRMLLSLA
jgi:hypothetical protein